MTPQAPNLPAERAPSACEVDPAGVAVPPPGGQVRSLDYCRKGHPYTPDNVGIHIDGHRFCIACKRLSRQAYTDRKRGNSPRECLTCVDVAWLRECGIPVQGIAERMHISVRTVEAHSHGHDMADV